VIGTNAAQATLIPDVSDAGKIIEAYYDPARKSYWMRNSREGWIEINETSLRRHLRGYGLKNRAKEGERLSQVEQKLNEIQYEQDVAYAGPLAGYRSGLMECAGNRVLVTSSPKLIVPVEGDWTIIDTLLQNLLVDDVYDQQPYLYGWLKVAYEALRRGVWRPGQAMGLAGPRDCGKSLLQSLITLILGGRSAKPYRYMTGGTAFNADLFGAEHLMIEDEHSSTDIRARRTFAAQIKQFTVNHTQSCHDKGRRAITLTPFWRVSISVNDEPEAMMVLPPMSDSDQDSLSDKLFLLRARKVEMPMPTTDQHQREAFWRALVSGLPGFVHFLGNWRIPEELRHGRFGVKTWHHPQLLAALESLAPETRLLGLIDEEIFSDSELGEGAVVRGKQTAWKGRAEKLEATLFRSSFGYEAKKLLSWSSATGTYLGRLASKRPDRVEKDRSSESRDWIVFPPGGRGSDGG
jgi:hypothetical protein